MNSGIEGLRQRAREVEENNRRQSEEMRRRSEREQDRRDEERRDRERLAAHSQASRSGGMAAPTILSFGLSLKLLGFGLAFVLVASVLSGLGSLNGFREAESTTDYSSGDVAEPKLSDFKETGSESKLSKAEVTERSTDARPTNTLNATEEPTEAELRGPTLSALDTGTSVAWEGRTAKGHVTVSEPVSVGEKTCRNVAYSSDGPVAAKPGTWCRTPDSDWVQQN